MTSKSQKTRQNNRRKNRQKYLKKADKDGYVVDLKRGIVEHRQVWKAFQGAIPKGWDIHHIDFNKSNNLLSNLIALPHAYHNKIHYEMDRGRPHYTREELWLKYMEFMKIEGMLSAKLAQAQDQVEMYQAQLNDLGGISFADKQQYKGVVPIRYTHSPKAPAPTPFVEKTILRKNTGT